MHCLYKCVGSTPTILFMHALLIYIISRAMINMMWAVDQNPEYHLEWLILRVRWNAYYLYTRWWARLQCSSLQNRLLVNYRSTVPVDLLYSLILDICVNSTFKNSLIQLDSARAHKFGENSGDKNTMPIVSAYNYHRSASAQKLMNIFIASWKIMLRMQVVRMRT